MQQVKAIDALYYPFTAEQQDRFWGSEDMQLMARTLLKGGVPKGYGGRCSPKEFVALMDEAGVEKVLIAAVKFYSWRKKEQSTEYTIDEVYETIREYPDRLIGLAGYNPFKIKESLEEIERAVKDYGFKGVYAHFASYGVRPNERRAYPLYAKCVELDIPVSMQVGHAMEVFPSDPGRPIHLDDIALEFPDLRLVGSHTGWPWCEEMIAMAWKHENVYVDVSAHHPRYLDRSILQFMSTRGQDKTLFGTNGWPFKLILGQFEELGLKEEVKRKVLRDNAVRVFKL